MTDFVEVWFGSPGSQDTCKWRIHLPSDLEFHFLLTLRYRSGLTCTNIVSVFSFLNLLSSRQLVFFPHKCVPTTVKSVIPEWGAVRKFALVPWIPETSLGFVISQLLFPKQQPPSTLFKVTLSNFYLAVALKKIGEINLFIRNILNNPKENLS